ncbi:MAG TPA: MoxR family ATPase [bacterium]|nr:MoxR family ATPase [bacterium]
MDANELLQKAVSLAPKVKAISQDVSRRHIQRDDIIKATWLAIVSGRPAFFLGTPGVDKTGTIKAMIRKIHGAVFYEALMPMLSSGSELIVESTSLREKQEPDGGKTISTVDKLGRAASAHIFFGDEIWKTPDVALKMLFDLFNMDDIRHDGQVVHNPLLTFLAASNELPEPESQLEALWSRMSIRVQVNSLNRFGKKQLVEARLNRYRETAEGEKAESKVETLTLEEAKMLKKARPFVEISEEIIETVLSFLEELLDDDSSDFQWAWDDDRRFGRLFDVMQANALLNGRTKVTKTDMSVLEWMLWDEPGQIAVLKAKLAPYTRTVLDEAQEVIDALLAPGGTVDTVLGGNRSKAVEALTQAEEAEKELKRLKGEADAQDAVDIEALLTQLSDTKKDIIAVVTGQKK